MKLVHTQATTNTCPSCASSDDVIDEAGGRHHCGACNLVFQGHEPRSGRIDKSHLHLVQED